MCSTCDELWAVAQDIDSPEEAIPAFQQLKAWIEGFRRNARSRPKGIDHFYDPNEREAYDDLFAVHANLRIISQMDSSHQQRSHKVRILAFYLSILMFDYLKLFKFKHIFL